METFAWRVLLVLLAVTHIHVIHITCPSMREPEKTFGRGRLGGKQDL